MAESMQPGTEVQMQVQNRTSAAEPSVWSLKTLQAPKDFPTGKLTEQEVRGPCALSHDHLSPLGELAGF